MTQRFLQKLEEDIFKEKQFKEMKNPKHLKIPDLFRIRHCFQTGNFFTVNSLSSIHGTLVVPHIILIVYHNLFKAMDGIFVEIVCFSK